MTSCRSGRSIFDRRTGRQCGNQRPRSQSDAHTVSDGAGPSPTPTAPDPGGRFRCQISPPGKYSLSATATGYLRLSQFETPQPRRSGTALSLAPGQKLSGIVLRLTPSSAISGRIVDQDGDPLAGVEMQLWTTSYFYNRKELSAATSPTVRTDDRGIYRIPLYLPVSTI